MSLTAGARLGPYEIVAPLGAGGMGEVYRAKDGRLNRTVAIKVMPADAAGDADRRERFEREAKAISALDHPNICALYDVGEHKGTYFLVMPCLEGQTLADRIAKGALPVDQAIKIAIEIATALDAAHRHGIVHRDLKPGNVMLTKTGVKLLDFGLAKLKKAAGPLTFSGMSALAGDTTQASGTGMGTLLGTMPYMSPEQIEGRDVDARSDIFSLGAVIYEMVTGHRAFKGDSPASVIGAILKDVPPPLKTVQPLAPAALDFVVNDCLAKDPDERWQSAADVARQLRWAGQGDSGAVRTAATKRTRLWPLLTSTVALLALLLAGWATWRPAADVPHLIRFELEAPRSYSFVASSATISVLQFAISPDGRSIAFVAARRGGEPMLWVRPLNDVASRELPGSSGASVPFWSPDSSMIGFFTGGRLKTIIVSTGEIRDICPASRNPRGGTWSPDGVILFGGDSAMGLRKVSVSTGVVETATIHTPEANLHRWPAFLPDGRRFLYYSRGQTTDRGIYLGSLDGAPPVRIVESAFSGAYAQGFLFTVRQGALLAFPFDERSGTITGDPIQVAERVGGSSTQNAAFSVSDTGILVYAGDANEISRLTWFDRSGLETDPRLPPASIATFRLSPDGRQVAMTRMDPVSLTADIWISDFERTASERFTVDPANDLGPLWSPDGLKMVFRSDRSGTNLLYRKASIGGTTDERVTTFDTSNPSDWSPNGRFVLFFQSLQQTSADLGLVDLEAASQPKFIVATPYDEFDGRFAPDGHWFAYVSNESGRSEVYVQPFPTTGARTMISSGGGTEPRWRRDGRELFYLAADGNLMSISVDFATNPRPGASKVLFQTRVPPPTTIYRTAIDVAADGQRFLIKTPLEGAPSPALTVVSNWMAGNTSR